MFFLALLVFAAIEIFAFVAVADHIGILAAVVAVLAISAAGPLLVRRSGAGVLAHARQRIQRGETPDREVLDGVVLLFGGVLVCIPGFVGDVIGLLLLLGPVRHAAIRLAGRQLARRVAAAGSVPTRYGTGRAAQGRGTVVDAATHDRSVRGPADPDESPGV